MSLPTLVFGVPSPMTTSLLHAYQKICPLSHNLTPADHRTNGRAVGRSYEAIVRCTRKGRAQTTSMVLGRGKIHELGPRPGDKRKAAPSNLENQVSIHAITE